MRSLTERPLTAALSVPVLLWVIAFTAGCGKITLKEGTYACTPGEPDNCPSGWACLPDPLGGGHLCFKSAATDGGVDGALDAALNPDGGVDATLADGTVDAQFPWDSTVQNDGDIADASGDAGPVDDGGQNNNDGGQNSNNGNANANDNGRNAFRYDPDTNSNSHSNGY